MIKAQIIPICIYLLKVNSGNTRTRCEKVNNMFKVNNKDTFIKKRLQSKCFLVNFLKCLRTLFFKEYLR